jgi:mannitol/fructose-specific phosphotransferase system IIA component (Ntr-type)
MQLIDLSYASLSLAEVFPTESIVIGLKQRTKPEVVAELVQHLVKLGTIAEGQAEALVQRILAREQLGSTAIGNGIAFPHCRSNLTDKFIGVLGLDPKGIPFDALDGKLVYSIFLLIAPLDARYYDVLGKVAAIGCDKWQRLRFRECRTPDEAHHYLLGIERA